MKLNQKGFIVPLLIAVISILVVGSSFYIYNKNNARQDSTQKDVSTIEHKTSQNATSTKNSENDSTIQKNDDVNLNKEISNIKTNSTKKVQEKTFAVDKNVRKADAGDTLTLSVTKNPVIFGDDLTISILPKLSAKDSAKVRNLNIHIYRPDGSLWQTVNTTWPKLNPCPPSTSGKGCYSDPSTASTVTVPFEGNNFELLASGTYKIAADSDDTNLKIVGASFKLDSSDIEEVLPSAAKFIPGYTLVGFQVAGANLYRAFYNTNGTEEEFFVEMYRFKSSDEAYTFFSQYTRFSKDKSIIDGNVIVGGAFRTWQSGKSVIVVQKNSDEVARTFLQKYPSSVKSGI